MQDSGKSRALESARVALLTIGTGPLASEVHDALRRHARLVAVVYSRKPGKTPIRRKFSDFGLWYVMQHLHWQLCTHLNRQRVQVVDNGVSHAYWKHKGDEPGILEWLKQLQVDVVVVCGFHHKLTPLFLDAFRYCLNVHPSLLPAYRGAEPLTWVLLERPSEFGVTVHHVDEGLDTGDLVLQKNVPTSGIRTLYGLESRLARELPQLLSILCTQLASGTVARLPQGRADYCPLPSLDVRKARSKQGIRHR